MKKIISVILFATMLLGMLAVVSSAIDTRYVEIYATFENHDSDYATCDHSDEDVTLKPGDELTLNIYMLKNDGTWSSKFEVEYDTSVLFLADTGVEYFADVFSKSEYVKAVPNNEKGTFTYYAEYTSLKEDNYKTGKLLTLKFNVRDTAINTPRSEMVKIVLPNGDGNGWFISTANLDTPFKVSVVNKLNATVAGSDNTSGPATDTDGLVSETSPNKKPAVAVIVDKDGNVVTDDKGAPETYEVGENEIGVGIETDEAGEYVTDDSGNFVTYYIDEKGNKIPDQSVPETEDGGKVVTTKKTAEEKEDVLPKNIRQIIIIASVAAVVVAAVIIIVVVTRKSKNDDIDPEE